MGLLVHRRSGTYAIVQLIICVVYGGFRPVGLHHVNAACDYLYLVTVFCCFLHDSYYVSCASLLPIYVIVRGPDHLRGDFYFQVGAFSVYG